MPQNCLTRTPQIFKIKKILNRYPWFLCGKNFHKAVWVVPRKLDFWRTCRKNLHNLPIRIKEAKLTFILRQYISIFDPSPFDILDKAFNEIIAFQSNSSSTFIWRVSYTSINFSKRSNQPQVKRFRMNFFLLEIRGWVSTVEIILFQNGT